jgi:hypothetical protein
MPHTAAHSRSRHTPRDHAQAFAIVLQREFGVPFLLYDAVTGAAVDVELLLDEGDARLAPTREPPPARLLAQETVLRRVEEGQAVVHPVGPALYELSLVLYHTGRPAFLAVGVFAGLARGPSEAEREARGLQNWLQSLSDRLRLSDQFLGQRLSAEDKAAQARLAWEALLSLDQVMRRLRVHKEPARNQQRVLETLSPLLGAQALVCIPPEPGRAVLINGEALLAPTDCVQLAGLLAKSPDYSGTGPIFCNRADTQPWALSFPNVATLLAMPIEDSDAPGWVIALNKGRKDDREPPGAPRVAVPFRRSDAALLTPFVALLRMHHAAASRFEDLKELMVGLARSLTAAIDAKDSYTFGHSERVARIAVELARALDLDADAQSDLYLAGLLHDVGKIGVPDAILRKPDKLTDEEFDVVKQHPVIGYSILSDLRPIRHLLPGVLYHHERYDGKGYPEGLAGEAIPRLARILAVADAYDAMSTNRPYRGAMVQREVEEQLRRGAGTQWDAQVVEAFLRSRQKIHAIRQRGVGESLRQALDGALRSKTGSTQVT